MTPDQVHALAPKLPIGLCETYAPLIDAAMLEASIVSPLRKAAFLAQICHESDGLIALEEYASGSEYEGRRDLGNVNPGDGRRYKGRGAIQLTGRTNYRTAGTALGLPLEDQPSLAAQPEQAFRIAGWYWGSRSLNALADLGRDGFDRITSRINGGQNGQRQRRALYERALALLGADGGPAPAGWPA